MALLPLVPLAAACGGGQAGGSGEGTAGTADPPSVTGVRWNIESVTVDGRTHRTESADAHLTFDAKTGKVGGRLGCNHVNASATVRDGHITLGAPATTRRMCEASLMHVERRLLSLFDSTLSYRVDQGTLTLTSENGGSLRAVAAG